MYTSWKMHSTIFLHFALYAIVTAASPAVRQNVYEHRGLQDQMPFVAEVQPITLTRTVTRTHYEFSVAATVTRT